MPYSVEKVPQSEIRSALYLSLFLILNLVCFLLC
jgi:hypothetical protein